MEESKKLNLNILMKYLLLIVYWSPLLILSVLFLPTGLVFVSFAFGVVHSWVLLESSSQLYGFGYFVSALLDFITIWLLPAAIAQLNCWFTFSLLALRCNDGVIEFGYIAMSGIVSGLMFLLLFFMSKLPEA